MESTQKQYEFMEEKGTTIIIRDGSQLLKNRKPYARLVAHRYEWHY